MFNKSVIKHLIHALKQIENAQLFKYEISKSYFYIFSNIEMLKENFSRISDTEILNFDSEAPIGFRDRYKK